MKSIIAPRQYHQTARAQSAELTARRIVDAFLARLMRQWFDEITLDLVAKDAGVTVQTVVRRFGGKEGLLADAVKILSAQIMERRAGPSGDLKRLVEKLIEDYEETGDSVIRLLALEPRHPPLKEFLDFGRSQHRRWVSTAFAEPLAKLNDTARKAVVDALVIVTDAYTWKLLRRDMGRSVGATAATFQSLIQATISEFLKSKQTYKTNE
jgi:AcrR family transcriptional regulator